MAGKLYRKYVTQLESSLELNRESSTIRPAFTDSRSRNESTSVLSSIVDRMKFGQFSDEQSFDSPEEIVVQLDLSSSLERNVVELSPQRVCKSVDRFVVENRNSE